jgi:hypothetical protein
MVDEKSERTVGSNVSPYLLRPLRTLKEAEQMNDAWGSQSTPVPSAPDSQGARSAVHGSRILS